VEIDLFLIASPSSGRLSASAFELERCVVDEELRSWMTLSTRERADARK
jgi:hypothetical protein